MRRPTEDQEVAGSTPAEVGNILTWRLIMKYFLRSFVSLPLIQEGQLSVSGESVRTILVNRLEDYARPVNVWLGKLTALDMTPLGWLGRKHKQTETEISVFEMKISLVMNLIVFNFYFQQMINTSLLKVFLTCLIFTKLQSFRTFIKNGH